MKLLLSFYNSIESILLSNVSLNNQLREMRDLLKCELSDDEFRLQCIQQVLSTIDNCDNEQKIWNAPHIFYHEKLRFSVRIIFWPGFYENNPHQHKTWGVTGVFHNCLNIHTYELLEDQKCLRKEKSIAASYGDTGYLFPSCIHNVSNPTHEVSASIHIFNNLNVDSPVENAIWYPAPRKYDLSKGLLDRALDACLAVVNNIESESSINVIRQIYAKSSLVIKLKAILAMYKYNKENAKSYYEELESTL